MLQEVDADVNNNYNYHHQNHVEKIQQLNFQIETLKKETNELKHVIRNQQTGLKLKGNTIRGLRGRINGNNNGIVRRYIALKNKYNKEKAEHDKIEEGLSQILSQSQIKN